MDMPVEVEGDENGGSQQPSSSDSGRILAVTKGIMEQLEEVLKNGREEGKTIIIAVVQQGNGGVEIQSLENFSAGGTRNDPPKEKALQLTFIGEVPDTVCTSTVLKSKNGECLKLALVDSETGKIVDSIPETCAEVVVLEGKSNVTLENFERRIIKRGEKKKPYFVNRIYIDLVKGVGDLSDVKLAQNSFWTRKCECRLGARIGQNLYAWTSPFDVSDKRLKDSSDKNEKHYPPMLSSEVWRLKQLGKGGEPHERLKGKDIKTVSDFLFWFHVDSEGLKKILLGDHGRGRGNSDWEAIVEHAKSCTIDDDQRMFSHKSSNEPQTCVLYSFVGKLKGVVINESHFVSVDNLSGDEKVHAYKLLSSVLQDSAFGKRHDTPFDVVASLPGRSVLEITASTDSSLQPLSDHIYQATERCSSSQNIDPNNLCDSGPPHSRVSEEMGELCNPADLGTLDHETPLLSDEVSRLVNICKNGEIHKCLYVNGINTVEDFLIRLLRDEEEIRQIVSLEREEWEAMVSNATRACSTGNRMYCYTSLKLMKGVVFNLLGDVLGLLSFHKHFSPTSMLSENDKREARELLASARKNWEDVEPYNEADHLVYQPSFSSESNIPFDSADYDDPFLCLSPNPMFDLYLENMLQPCGKFHEGLEDSQHYGADAEPHHVSSPRDGPKGWKLVKFVVCFPKWWFSITVRVPRPHHVTRKRKR